MMFSDIMRNEVEHEDSNYYKMFFVYALCVMGIVCAFMNAVLSTTVKIFGNAALLCEASDDEVGVVLCSMISVTYCVTHPLTHCVTHPLTHCVTHPLTVSLTHSLCHTLTVSLTHCVTHSLCHCVTHSLTHSRTHCVTHSLTHSLCHSLTHSLTHSLCHSLTHALTVSLTHSLTHPLIGSSDYPWCKTQTRRVYSLVVSGTRVNRTTRSSVVVGQWQYSSNCH